MWDPSSQTRDRTPASCAGRQSLNHWIAGEVPLAGFLRREGNSSTSISETLGSWSWSLTGCFPGRNGEVLNGTFLSHTWSQRKQGAYPSSGSGEEGVKKTETPCSQLLSKRPLLILSLNTPLLPCLRELGTWEKKRGKKRKEGVGWCQPGRDLGPEGYNGGPEAAPKPSFCPQGHPWACGRRVKCFTQDYSFTLTAALGGWCYYLYIPISQMRKLRLRPGFRLLPSFTQPVSDDGPEDTFLTMNLLILASLAICIGWDSPKSSSLGSFLLNSASLHLSLSSHILL